MAPSRTVGVKNQQGAATNINDGTLCRQKSPKPGIIGAIDSALDTLTTPFVSVIDTGEAWLFAAARLPRANPKSDVSFELQEALSLPDVSSSLPALSHAERKVLAWLRKYKGLMVGVEQEFKVDRRAIAGVIAWEALQNVRWDSIRAVGPGKVHFLTALLMGTDNTIAKEVEECGFLAPTSFLQRVRLLETAQGAIEYIGAIMTAISDRAAKYQYGIRCNPPVLTTVYVAWDLPEWESKLLAKNAAPLEPGEPMGTWVRDHMDYLIDAVGTPVTLSCFATEKELRSQNWDAYPNSRDQARKADG